MSDSLDRLDTPASRQRFVDQLLRHSPTLMFVRDRTGRYVKVSRSYCEVFGLSEEDLLDRTPMEVFGEVAGRRLRSTDEQVFAADSAMEVDVEVDTPSGLRAYRCMKFPLRTDDGNTWAVCGLSTDVTVRRRHEMALQSVALAVSGAQGESLFEELAKYLAQVLEVEGAFIATCPSGEAHSVSTVCLYADGRFEDNFSYDLAGTVCGTVVGREFRIVQQGLQALYPDDRLFRRLNIESYAAYPLMDSHGHPLGLIAVMSRRPLRDDTLARAMLRIFATRAEAEIERLRAEEELRLSESSYRAIFEASEDAIFVHDWDTGAIVDVNEKACRTYGYSLEEMRSINIGDISLGQAPYENDEARRRIDAARSDGPQRFVWRSKSRDGTLRWDEVQLKSALIGGKKRVLAVVRDFTARIEAEKTLRDAAVAVSSVQGESVFRDLVAALSAILKTDMALIAVPKTDDPSMLSMLALQVDRQTAQSFDYPLEGTPCQHVVGKSYRAWHRGLREHFSLDTDFHRMGIESYAGFPLNGPQGEVLGVISVACRRPLENPETVEAVLGIFATRAVAEIERRHAEQALRAQEAQLRQAQKMEAIGQLTGGIAHDFNNILTSILGYLMLSSEYQEEHFNDDKLARYLDEAQGSAKRARDLIQQMLTFSRGQRGTPRPVRLARVVDEGLKMLRATLPASIELVSKLDHDAPPAMLDPVHLGQVLLNLCINSRDALGRAGRINVKVGPENVTHGVCASCRQQVQGAVVTLSVRDTGPGITQAVQDRMFEPFFTTKEVGKGSGMGLAMVHGIVHEYGGHLLLDTAPGRGTRFRVVFPALDVAELHDDASSTPVRNGRTRQLKGRVLVVDDERVVGAFMRDLLQNWGLDVVVELNPQRAEDLVRDAADAFDLVITDQAMPRMPGTVLADRLHSQWPDLPILLYTGYGEDFSETNLQRSGIRSVFRKPVDPQVLFGLLQNNLPAA